MTDLQQPACTPLNLGVGAEGNPGETPGAAFYSRRQIMRAFALGGAFVAGTLWIPGQRLISIPKPQLKYKATEHLMGFNLSVQQMVDEAFDIEYKRYHDLWIVCSQEGGAMLSKDGIEWERIKPSELYVTDQALEECGA